MQKGNLFTRLSFLLWLAASVWHSLVTYFGVMFLFSNDVLRTSGVNADIWTMGTFASTIVIVIVNLRMALETRYAEFKNVLTTELGIFSHIFQYGEVFWLIL